MPYKWLLCGRVIYHKFVVKLYLCLASSSKYSAAFVSCKVPEHVYRSPIRHHNTFHVFFVTNNRGFNCVIITGVDTDSLLDAVSNFLLQLQHIFTLPPFPTLFSWKSPAINVTCFAGNLLFTVAQIYSTRFKYLWYEGSLITTSLWSAIKLPIAYVFILQFVNPYQLRYVRAVRYTVLIREGHYFAFFGDILRVELVVFYV